MSSLVSIVLQNTDDARAIIDAVMTDNPEAVASRYPAMVKIDSPGELVMNRASIADRLGRDFELQEIHLCLVNISGNIDEDDDRIVLRWNS